MQVGERWTVHSVDPSDWLAIAYSVVYDTAEQRPTARVVMTRVERPRATVDLPIRFISLTRDRTEVAYTAAVFPEGEPAYAVSGMLDITSRQGNLVVDSLAEAHLDL